MNNSKIILAVDGLTAREAIKLVSVLGPHLYAVKIHDLYDLNGPIAARMLKNTCPSLKVWVDYKLFDIPATMERRAKALFSNGADIITVSTEAGHDGMKAAKQSGAIIYAVTVLTSERPEQTRARTGRDTADVVLRRARQAVFAGVDGIVCSSHEVGMLASDKYLDHKAELIAVGVRSAGVETNDQQRVDTPANAIKAGAHRFVVGRQLTRAEDSIAEFRRIEEETGLLVLA